MTVQASMPNIVSLHTQTSQWIGKMALPRSPSRTVSYATELCWIAKTAFQNSASIGYRMWELKSRIVTFRENLIIHEQFKITPEQLKQINEIEKLIALYLTFPLGEARNHIGNISCKEIEKACQWLFLQTKNKPYPRRTGTVLSKDTASHWNTQLEAVIKTVNSPGHTQSDLNIYTLYKEKMLPLCKQIIRHKEGPHWSLLLCLGFIEQEVMKNTKWYLVSLFTIIGMEDRERNRKMPKPFDPLGDHDPSMLKKPALEESVSKKRKFVAPAMKLPEPTMKLPETTSEKKSRSADRPSPTLRSDEINLLQAIDIWIKSPD